MDHVDLENIDPTNSESLSATRWYQSLSGRAKLPETYSGLKMFRAMIGQDPFLVNWTLFKAVKLELKPLERVRISMLQAEKIPGQTECLIRSLAHIHLVKDKRGELMTVIPETTTEEFLAKCVLKDHYHCRLDYHNESYIARFYQPVPRNPNNQGLELKSYGDLKKRYNNLKNDLDADVDLQTFDNILEEHSHLEADLRFSITEFYVNVRSQPLNIVVNRTDQAGIFILLTAYYPTRETIKSRFKNVQNFDYDTWYESLTAID